jgi:hypothetical protein
VTYIDERSRSKTIDFGVPENVALGVVPGVGEPGKKSCRVDRLLPVEKGSPGREGGKAGVAGRLPGMGVGQLGRGCEPAVSNGFGGCDSGDVGSVPAEDVSG